MTDETLSLYDSKLTEGWSLTTDAQKKLTAAVRTQRQEIERLKGELDHFKKEELLICEHEALVRGYSKLNEDFDRLTREKESAERTCAAMREALITLHWTQKETGCGNYFYVCSGCGREQNSVAFRKHSERCIVNNALSTDAGKAFVRREVLVQCEKALIIAKDEVEYAGNLSICNALNAASAELKMTK